MAAPKTSAAELRELSDRLRKVELLLVAAARDAPWMARELDGERGRVEAIRRRVQARESEERQAAEDHAAEARTQVYPDTDEDNDGWE